MDVKKLVSEMTLEEKAALCSGADFWHTKAVERLGVPRMMVADGPHGLRKQDQSADHLGINDSIRAVCFPTAAGLACSFDRDLLFRVGEALAYAFLVSELCWSAVVLLIDQAAPGMSEAWPAVVQAALSCALVLDALVPDALVPEALPSAEQPAVIPMANATAIAGNRPRIHFFFILFHLRCFIRMSFSNILPFIITHILFQ